MKTGHLLASLALLALSVPLAATADPATPVGHVPADEAPKPAADPAGPAFAPWGVDLDARDLSVKPGDDFGRYASGKWLDRATIPADRTSTGAFENLAEAVQAQMRDLITGAPARGDRAESKFGALYASYVDEARVEAVGLAPLKADLARLNAVADKAAFARYMGASNGAFGMALVDFDISPDTADASRNV